MKLRIVLVLTVLFLPQIVSIQRNQIAQADTLKEEYESRNKKRHRQLSPEAMQRRARDPWFRMLAGIENKIAPTTLLYAGFILMAGGFVYFLVKRRRTENLTDVNALEIPTISVLFVILAAGSFLRLHNLDEKSLDHTEIFVPGISLPNDLSAPPPRITLADTIWWHFHVEPHPPGYYFLMWPWTRIFATSEFALRLPSALFGIASIWLIFQIVTITHSKTAGIFAAALLAFNGHHIFWSQMARMYSMTCFLGLLSTLLLLRMVHARSGSVGLEAGYAGVSLLGVFTEILFWPFLLTQALWVAIALNAQNGHPNRILRLQAIVMMIGAPLWAHAVYRSRPSPLEGPSLSFLQHFFTFGFLIHPDPFAMEPDRAIPLLIVPVFCLSIGLLLLAFRVKSNKIPVYGAPDAGPFVTLPIAVGSISTTIGYSLLALSRRPAMAKTILVPVAALFLPWILAQFGRLVRNFFSRLRRADCLESSNLLYFLFVFVPGIAVFILSYRFSLLGTRLYLLFVPFLLSVIAIGITGLLAKRRAFVAVAAMILAVHAFSVFHYLHAFSTPNDYKGLAHAIHQRFEKGDLIFVRAKHWGVTPLFYYFPDHHHALIAREFEEAVAEQGTGKVFVVHMEGLPATPPMDLAVKDLVLKERIRERRAYADVYQR